MHISIPFWLSKNLWLCCWVVCVLDMGSAKAQAGFALEDGNQNIRIQCLSQHPNGALLVGTSAGLYQFNG